MAASLASQSLADKENLHPVFLAGGELLLKVSECNQLLMHIGWDANDCGHKLLRAAKDAQRAGQEDLIGASLSILRRALEHLERRRIQKRLRAQIREGLQLLESHEPGPTAVQHQGILRAHQ